MLRFQKRQIRGGVIPRFCRQFLLTLVPSINYGCSEKENVEIQAQYAAVA